MAIFTRKKQGQSSPPSSRRQSEDARDARSNSRFKYLFGRDKIDPDREESIIEARKVLSQAQTAEVEADEALKRARSAVKAARQHIKDLETNVKRENKLAKAKSQTTKEIVKDAKRLGRHD